MYFYIFRHYLRDKKLHKTISIKKIIECRTNFTKNYEEILKLSPEKLQPVKQSSTKWTMEQGYFCLLKEVQGECRFFLLNNHLKYTYLRLVAWL